MSKTTQSLIWAGVIIAAALITQTMGLSDGASIGVTMGLVGAASGSLTSDLGCGRRCLL